jgi:hypothetical protein
MNSSRDEFLDNLTEQSGRLHELLLTREDITGPGIFAWHREVCARAADLMGALSPIVGTAPGLRPVVQQASSSPTNTSKLDEIRTYMEHRGPASVKVIASDTGLGISTVSGWLRRRARCLPFRRRWIVGTESRGDCPCQEAQMTWFQVTD